MSGVRKVTPQRHQEHVFINQNTLWTNKNPHRHKKIKAIQTVIISLYFKTF